MSLKALFVDLCSVWRSTSNNLEARPRGSRFQLGARNSKQGFLLLCSSADFPLTWLIVINRGEGSGKDGAFVVYKMLGLALNKSSEPFLFVGMFIF